ncbi:MAG TPA: hypothetical protein VNA28_13250 [Solirubrobacteraceae bacterium]|nr:hypothetical protein [Solirubrobacteraceae bacterium]
MSHIRTSLLTTAVIGAVLAPAVVAHAAPATLASELAPTRVAAWEGTAMWSRYNPASNNYTLVKSVGGAAPVPVAVPARAGGPFDIDLGTDRSGNTVAVYTRDGDIYRQNVEIGTELKIKQLASSRIDRDPTIHNGRLAFIRRVGDRDELRLASITGASRGETTLVSKRKIVHAELGEKHVVYVLTGPGPISDEGATFVRIRNLDTKADRQIYRAVSGGANFARVTRPTYVAKPAGFFWTRTNQGSGVGNRFIRYTLRGSRFANARGVKPRYSTSAWAGAALGAIVATTLEGGESIGNCADGGVNYCQVELTGRLTFNATP